MNAPGPPIEATIALSIAFVAAEIIHGRQGRPGLTERYPWTVAFIFGLLHGFGFASALTQIGLPQQSITLALLFFNVAWKWASCSSSLPCSGPSRRHAGLSAYRCPAEYPETEDTLRKEKPSGRGLGYCLTY